MYTTRSDQARSGFTILEIMISVAILTIGLMGILALFPVAIETSRITIQDTNAVLIAQSVEQAIREGLAHRKAQSDDGKWTYFIFQHDGVKDTVPRRIKNADSGSDYFVLLPDSDPDRGGQSTRERAFEQAKTFVYPETDGKSWTTPDGTEDTEDSGHSPNGGGNPTRADDDADDRELSVEDADLVAADGEVVSTTYDVFNTFPLGQSHLNEDEVGEGNTLMSDKIDPLSTYSFAFAIKRSFDDANKIPTTGTRAWYSPQGELYQVTIMVFRSFRRGTTNADPIYETTILVHK